jgi:hypothetical protein
MISKKRLTEICQRKMAKAYDKKVQPRGFKEGDHMLRNILQLPGEDHSKWALNYEGPYIVKKTFSRGALLMIKMDEEDLIRHVNSNFVKKYYPSCVSFHQINKTKF